MDDRRLGQRERRGDGSRDLCDVHAVTRLRPVVEDERRNLKRTAVDRRLSGCNSGREV